MPSHPSVGAEGVQRKHLFPSLIYFRATAEIFAKLRAQFLRSLVVPEDTHSRSLIRILRGWLTGGMNSRY